MERGRDLSHLYPVRVHGEVRERTPRGCSLRSYPRLLSGDAFSVGILLPTFGCVFEKLYGGKEVRRFTLYLLTSFPP